MYKLKRDNKLNNRLLPLMNFVFFQYNVPTNPVNPGVLKPHQRK